MNRFVGRYTLVWSLLGLVTALGAAQAQDARKTYDTVCAGCHNTGLIGAPKVGTAADWSARLQAGMATVYRNAIAGTPKGMPPKGGRAELSDADVRGVVDYMLSRSGVSAPVSAAKPPAAKPAAAPPPAATPPTPSAPSAASVSTPPVNPAPAAQAVAVVARPPAAPITPAAEDVNAFNRLLRPASKGNLAPAEDGIHDPTNDGTHSLQPPMLSFGKLPRSPAGNRVDWVAALDQKRLQPRWDRNDPNAAPVVMDLNIVREVKGSMPDVVYPHKQHTEWLDCSNCHPSIFVPQKGANQITMAGILLGQQCGVCHGKVAFPVSECRLCHSKKKDTATAATGNRAQK